MVARGSCPAGAPTWVDLWTSDVDRASAFYSGLLGWEVGEVDPDHGGYFMFMRSGVPVAGGMGDMGDMKANDAWKIYLATDDMEATATAASAHGAELAVPPMPVDDLGIQLVMTDPTGAAVGAWQAGTFPGFTVLDEPGAPSWFELHTRDHAGAVAFYRDVFGWETTVVGDSDEFRYTIAMAPGSDTPVCGVFDVSSFTPPGVGPTWTVYWEVEDVATSLALVADLGGTVVDGPATTPYGTTATAADPCGAVFRLRTGGVESPLS